VWEMSFRKLFEQCDNDKMVLPDFQRDFVWKTDGLKRLLCSFMFKLPIGSLLILEGKGDDFKSRKLCFPKREITPKEECRYLLDGQQRLSALKVVFSDIYSGDDWKTTLDETYSQLRPRWFVRVIPQKNEEDLFGWRTLSFPDWSSWEPQQLSDFLQIRHIFKTTNLDKWYHPSYNPPDQKGNPKNPNLLGLDIAINAFNEGGLVPLFSIYKDSLIKEKTLLERVLEIIAQRRIEVLQEVVKEDEQMLIDLLQKCEPDIVSILESKDDSAIKFAWLKLSAQWVSDVQKYLESLLEQEPHIISLESKEIGRAISIFENINQGGTALNVYDLIVAKAAHDTSLEGLTQRIVECISQNVNLPFSLTYKLNGDKPTTWNPQIFGCIDDNQPINIMKYEFLNLLSVLAHCENNLDDLRTDHIKKGKILALNHVQINSFTAKTVLALARAFAFLQFRCGVIKLQNIPYELMVIPIAFHLRDDAVWNSHEALDRLEYWYWTSIFGGAYRQAQNDRAINDLKVLKAWVVGGTNFLGTVYDSILNFQGYSNKLVLMMKDPDNTLPGALYNATLQYILSQQPLDFLPGVQIRLNPWDIASNKELQFDGTNFDLSIQDHHIVPLGMATTLGQSSDKLRAEKTHPLNSVLNRTFISWKANDLIRSRAPLDYLSYMNTISLYGHCIPLPFATQYQKNAGETDDVYYENVLTNRFNELKKVILLELEGLKH